MSSSRTRILGRLKSGTKAEARSEADIATLKARLKRPQRGIIPEFTKVKGTDVANMFLAKAEAQGNTLVRVQSADAALGEVREFLRTKQFAGACRSLAIR